MSSSRASSSSVSAVSTFLSYVETSIYVYLHNRKVYAENAFDRRRAFDVVVYSSRQPELISYVQDTLNGLRPFIEQGTLKQICAVLRDERASIVERLEIHLVDFRAGDGSKAFGALVGKDGARAGLVRLSRLQLPQLSCSNFALVFEIQDQNTKEDSDQGQSDFGDSWIVHDNPVFGASNSNTLQAVRQSTVPIVTLADDDVSQRVVVKIETTLV